MIEKTTVSRSVPSRQTWWLRSTPSCFAPSLAIAWRRLHDAGFPGPYYFLTLVPSVGSIIVLVLMLLPSKPEGQRFDRPSQVSSGR